MKRKSPKVQPRTSWLAVRDLTNCANLARRNQQIDNWKLEKSYGNLANNYPHSNLLEAAYSGEVGGGGVHDGDAHRNFQKQLLKVTNTGVAPAYFDP